MVEPLTMVGVAAVTEKTGEAAVQETIRQSLEISRKAAEWNGSTELEPSTAILKRLNGMLDQERYRKLNEFREVSHTHPEAIQEAYNNVQLKGQMGESIMESKLSAYGDVRSQVPVQLDGAPTSNRIDLQLEESNANLKQLEMKLQDGEITLNRNYDLMKGESASFEVKNGGLPYLRQELLNGELQQQIAAGAKVSDHSFVVINEDTAKALLHNPEQAAKVIGDIQDAGGKLIVGLPSQSVQLAIFMS